jgi:hypothetical protein
MSPQLNCSRACNHDARIRACDRDRASKALALLAFARVSRRLADDRSSRTDARAHAGRDGLRRQLPTYTAWHFLLLPLGFRLGSASFL